MDPVNRLLINQDQALLLRTGLPSDQMPTHVTGGIPIQQYLKELLERMPNPPPDDIFSLASFVNDGTQDVASRTTMDSDSQLDGMQASVFARNEFLDNFIAWTERHVRVKVQLAGLERSCYVWQSIMEDSIPGPENESLSRDSSEDVPQHELNISPPDLEPEEEAQPGAVFVAPVPDPVHGATMFQR